MNLVDLIKYFNLECKAVDIVLMNYDIYEKDNIEDSGMIEELSSNEAYQLGLAVAECVEKYVQVPYISDDTARVYEAGNNDIELIENYLDDNVMKELILKNVTKEHLLDYIMEEC